MLESGGDELFFIDHFLLNKFQAPVAQLDRATDYGSVGWRFESSRARQIFQQPMNLLVSLPQRFSGLARTYAVAKLLIEKGVFTQDEFMEKIKAERATYQAMLQKVSH